MQAFAAKATRSTTSTITACRHFEGTKKLCNDTNYQYNASVTRYSHPKTLQKASLVERRNYISVSSILSPLILDGQVQPELLNSAFREQTSVGKG